MILLVDGEAITKNTINKKDLGKMHIALRYELSSSRLTYIF